MKRFGVIGWCAPGAQRQVRDDVAMHPAPAPLLPPKHLNQLRHALTAFTVDGVGELLGPIGTAAQSRGDLAGVARAVRTASTDDRPLATLVTLFLLADPVPEADARRALAPLSLDVAAGAGLVEVSAGEVRARFDIRPYAEDVPSADPWWVVSDLGSDVRPGPLAADHVLGIGAAALTLAQSTPRDEVARALDVGTGCGIQALHLSQHATRVTATDISVRALQLAATTAALSGRSWDLRQGSLLDPVRADGDGYDLVVANPPFVVSPGTGEHDYRDSGLAGDAVCRTLVQGLPAVLAPGGTAQLLANWIVPTDGTWQDRVAGWFADAGCDAWVWQREVADPGEYVAMWLRDAGHVPGTADWRTRYDAWADWFVAHGVAAVGMGLVTMWRRDSADPVRVFEDVPQAVAQPVGAQFPAWIDRQRWLAGRTDADLLRETLHAAPDLVRTRQDLLDDDGWTVRRSSLRQSHGLRWEIEVDDAVAAVVAGCHAGAPPGLALDLWLAGTGDPTSVRSVQADPAVFASVLRDLVARGLLLPGARQ